MYLSEFVTYYAFSECEIQDSNKYINKYIKIKKIKKQFQT